MGSRNIGAASGTSTTLCRLQKGAGMRDQRGSEHSVLRATNKRRPDYWRGSQPNEQKRVPLLRKASELFSDVTIFSVQQGQGLIQADKTGKHQELVTKLIFVLGVV